MTVPAARRTGPRCPFCHGRILMRISPAARIGDDQRGRGRSAIGQLLALVPGVNETPRSTWPNPAVRSVAKLSAPGAVAASWSVMVTSWLGSAPWSPSPLTVEVMAQIVTVPSGLTRPVMFRRPSVAGAHGRPVAGLLPAGYPGTV